MKLVAVYNNPNIDINRKVVAIPKHKIIEKELLIGVLKTHPNLSKEDIDFVLFTILNQNISITQFVKILLHSYLLSNTGRFSLIFNTLLETYIKTKNKSELLLLVNDIPWPELYNNPYLSSEEVEIILSMYSKELNSLMITYEKAINAKLDYSKALIPCEVSETNSLYLTDNITYNSIYTQCYDEICISESTQKGKIISLNTNEIPQVAYVNDSSKQHCFHLLTLIERLAKGNYNNPDTGLPFSTITLKQLSLKYEKEIKMYKRFLEII